MKSSRFILLISAATFVALALVAFRRNRPIESNPAQVVSDDRLAELRLRVERENASARQAIDAYRPTRAGRIDDFAVMPEEILRGLPGVVAVDVPVRPPKPVRRIIHLRDLHFVPRDLFAIDVRQAADRKINDAEVARLHEEHMLETELVQIEQMAILRFLARHHGLRTIRIEGLTAKEVKLFRDRVAALKEIAREELAARKQLGEVRELMRTMDPADSRYRQASVIESELLGLIGQSRPLQLEIGAAGRLLMGGEIDAVLYLDDEAALHKANPVTPGGRLRIDAARAKQREDAMVRAALDGGPFSLIILGGAHDLSDSVRRLAGDCEYVRITMRAYREFQGK